MLADDNEAMYMIKLELEEPRNTLGDVRRIAGLGELDIDEDYGVVPVDPRRGLYVIRVRGQVDTNKLRALGVVRGVYGDTRVAAIHQGNKNLEE